MGSAAMLNVWGRFVEVWIAGAAVLAVRQLDPCELSSSRMKRASGRRCWHSHIAVAGGYKRNRMRTCVRKGLCVSQLQDGQKSESQF